MKPKIAMALLLLAASAGRAPYPDLVTLPRSLVCPHCGAHTWGATVNEQYCGDCKVTVDAVLR